MPMGHPGALSRRPLSIILEQPLVATIAAGVNAVIIYTAEIIPATGSAVYVATEQYATLVSDSRPSIPFNATMEHAPRFKRSIKSGDGFGKMSSGFGDLTIQNAGGEYDTLLASPLDGARVICKLGWRGISYDRFITIFDGQVDTAESPTIDTIVFHFQDDNKRLEVLAQPNIYGGTGGIDGDANVKGKRKPILLGTGANMSAVLIDATNLVYQWHDGITENVYLVYDRGVALPVNATPDYANYAALIAATISPGRYATCKALGIFRLGAKPDGVVTITATGAVYNGLVANPQGLSLGGTLQGTSVLMHYLLSISSANIVVDSGSVLATYTAQPAPIGYFIGPDDNKTIGQVFDDLMGGIGGYAGFRSDRTFNMGIFTLPTGAVVGDFTDKDWYALTRPQLPTIAAVPPSRWFAAYSRNFTQQPDIDATVDAGTQTLRKDQYSIAQSNDAATTAAIQTAHRSSTDSAIILSWFVNASDAIAECNRRLVLYGGALRALFRVDLTQIAFSLDVGMVERLTDTSIVPRFGLGTPKSMTVVEIDNGFDDGVISVEGFA